MKQPTAIGGTVKRKKKKPTRKKKASGPNTPNVVKFATRKYTRGHPEYGTSQLEKDFATDFLDYLGLTYIYQYKAESIGRYYDFAVTVYDKREYVMEVKDGVKCVKQEGQIFPVTLLIEVDGDYWHPDEKMIKEGKLTPTQKHNMYVDSVKNRWAALNCIVLLRFRESEIRNDRTKVLNEIRKYIKEGQRKKEIKENKNKPH